jgi:hypothetical protein
MRLPKTSAAIKAANPSADVWLRIPVSLGGKIEIHAKRPAAGALLLCVVDPSDAKAMDEQGEAAAVEAFEKIAAL